MQVVSKGSPAREREEWKRYAETNLCKGVATQGRTQRKVVVVVVVFVVVMTEWGWLMPRL